MARAVGVSPTTVSHVFNRPERGSRRPTRERVLRAVAEIGYTGHDPNRPSAAPRPRRCTICSAGIPV
ncbi:MAG TPA: LacI family DNA-binding transcriptional regulator [Nakamurella sp.]